MFLHVAEPPRMTTHPQDLKNAVPGSLAKFTVQVTGTNPLSYHWQWKPVAENESEKWQSCDAEWCDGATLTIPSVQKTSEGSYHCIVSNCAGTLISKSAQLNVGKERGISYTSWYQISLVPRPTKSLGTRLVPNVRNMFCFLRTYFYM